MAATYPKTDGDALNADDVNAIPPIGSVMAWLKSLTGCPALAENWVECNGQVLSDAESPFNGETIPNLNGSGASTKRFLRGHTASGATGGADTVAHTHNTVITSEVKGDAAYSTPVAAPGTYTSGAASDANNLPSYYEVVWIIKIK